MQRTVLLWNFCSRLSVRLSNVYIVHNRRVINLRWGDLARLKVSLCSRFDRNGLPALYGFKLVVVVVVYDHDFNIMQQSLGLFAIAKLLVTPTVDLRHHRDLVIWMPATMYMKLRWSVYRLALQYSLTCTFARIREHRITHAQKSAPISLHRRPVAWIVVLQWVYYICYLFTRS